MELPLAHPVTTDESFKISLFIGVDHYWHIVEDNIARGNGPTAMASKLGYLLSGPLPAARQPMPFILESQLRLTVILRNSGT